jgi:hypothetical protein
MELRCLGLLETLHQIPAYRPPATPSSSVGKQYRQRLPGRPFRPRLAVRPFLARPASQSSPAARVSAGEVLLRADQNHISVHDAHV